MHLQKLFDADIGLQRACRLGEHTEADFSGLEHDYIRLYPDSIHRQILRLASLFQDIGKSFYVKDKGDNKEQSTYNLKVAVVLLDAIDFNSMTGDAKNVVKMLIEFDVVGHLLRGKFDQAKIDALRSRWPARFADQLDDFVVTSYMSDASAHTAHRTFTDMKTGEPRRCVTPEDASLDFLFEPAAEGQPVTLTQPFRRAVAVLFPNAQAMAGLLHDDVEPEPSHPRNYPDMVEADGVWSTTLGFSSQPYDNVKQQLEAFTMTTGFPVSALIKRGREDMVNSIKLVRDPSRRFGTLEPEAHELALTVLRSWFGWEQLAEETDERPEVSACVGLLEGYDEKTGIHHKPAEAVTYLLEQGQTIHWRTKPLTLVATRRIWNEQTEQNELQASHEKVMLITGTRRRPDAQSDASANPALDHIRALAGSLKQERFFVEDGIAGKTRAYYAAS